MPMANSGPQRPLPPPLHRHEQGKRMAMAGPIDERRGSMDHSIRKGSINDSIRRGSIDDSIKRGSIDDSIKRGSIVHDIEHPDMR